MRYPGIYHQKPAGVVASGRGEEALGEPFQSSGAGLIPSLRLSLEGLNLSLSISQNNKHIWRR